MPVEAAVVVIAVQQQQGGARRNGLPELSGNAVAIHLEPAQPAVDRLARQEAVELPIGEFRGRQRRGAGQRAQAGDQGFGLEDIGHRHHRLALIHGSVTWVGNR